MEFHGQNVAAAIAALQERKLKVVDVSGAFMSEANFVRVAEALSHASPTIDDLNLSGNPAAGDAGAAALAGALRANACPRLQYLSLSGCGIGEPGIASLTSALAEQCCPRLEHLNLEGNACSSPRLLALVADKCPNIRELWVDGDRNLVVEAKRWSQRRAEQNKL